MILYGISNCDTVRKARRWLDAQQIDYRFHDFRRDGLETELVERWHEQLGAALLNTRGTTWRQLPEALRNSVTDETRVALLMEHPTLIKRPLLDDGTRCLSGFNETLYSDFINGEAHG